ncbi:hypothetical protein HPB52_010653 [Rhipicephalus sanguineus]|uniref:THAP-type domain-containing protein n=1 Tax=Rhipicephalus sanguineus TaxID=34632 RepID=A0A9D4T1R9_RHISA|nr:hypothetical protein HPB52_010653 [Rhipicephalus sanguineus]
MNENKYGVGTVPYHCVLHGLVKVPKPQDVVARRAASIGYGELRCLRLLQPHKNSPNDENFQRVGFYVVPKVISGQCAKTTELSSKRRALWLSRIRREDLDESATHYRVCGAHFITGERGSSIKCVSSAL